MLTALIGIGVGLVVYSLSLDHSTPFNQARINRATVLYDNVMSFGITYNYPLTPEELMSKKSDILMLLYGEFIVDDALFSDVIAQQRLLLGDEILRYNTFESQLQNFMDTLSEIRTNNIRLMSIDVLPIVSQPSIPYFAIARVVQNFENVGRVHMLYYLGFSVDDGKWRILSWAEADENFEAVL